MKTFKNQFFVIVASSVLLFILTANFSFGQWIASESSFLVNTGSLKGNVAINSNILNGTTNIGASSKVVLEQNYPNPFNPVTIIGYDIPQDAKVIIKVYEISGNEIYTIVNKQQAAGHHFVKFDATNFSSGIYYYKIKVIDSKGTVTEESKTMSVVK